MIKVQLMQTASSGTHLMKRNVPPPHTHNVCMCVVLCVRVWL